MQNLFYQHLQSQFPFLENKKLLLAVSGGIDSMVLLHLLQQLPYTIAIAHCNFQLRGIESFEDQSFVQEYALQHQIPFYCTQFDTQAFANDYKLSTQVAARELRYDWFYEQLETHHYDFIVMRRPRVIAEKKIATKAMSKVGLTAYDFEGLLIKQPIELLTGKWNKKKEKHEEDKMYCSEFVSWVYGLDDSYRMSPKDFLDYCLENSWDEIHNTGITL
ncbi:MAG: ATP-binding protein [Flavobacterium sp.]